MAYGTDSGADVYHEQRNNTVWATLSDDAKTGARVRVSDYIDAMYGSRFPGVKTGGRVQENQWPRTGATDSSGVDIAPNEVPLEIIKAVYEGALLEGKQPGILAPTTTPKSQKVLTEVKGIKWTIVGDKTTSAPTYLPQIPIIDALMAGLLGVPDFGSVLVIS